VVIEAVKADGTTQRFSGCYVVRRSDLAEDCSEGFDLDFLRWIWRYSRDDRPQVLQMLDGLNGRAVVRHLRSRSDVRRYVSTL